MDQLEIDLGHMRRALELAARGEGHVEPNPMVGCVVAAGAEVLGEGWHRRFGQAHAEVEALGAAGSLAAGATLYVTLEPCCHWGKTPPCSQAVLAAGIRRVVVAMGDPFPQVAGGGLAELRAAGIKVEVGLLEDEARRLTAPYRKLLSRGRPWIIAKWAMTLDGKIATHGGDSRWISNDQSREIVHALRGRVDAIMIGRATAEHDDPLLTVRPPGPRTPLRIVVDTRASLDSASQLVRTARAAPLLVAVGQESTTTDRQRLSDAGCQILVCDGGDHAARLLFLLDELGRRRMTNLLVEGGGQFLGALFDAGQIDEAHVFIAPKLVGGGQAVTPIAGRGIVAMASAVMLHSIEVRQVAGDLYLHGRIGDPAGKAEP